MTPTSRERRPQSPIGRRRRLIHLPPFHYGVPAGSRIKSTRSNTPPKNSKKGNIKRITHNELSIMRENHESLFFSLLKIPPCVFNSEYFRSSSPPLLLLPRRKLYPRTVPRVGGNEWIACMHAWELVVGVCCMEDGSGFLLRKLQQCSAAVLKGGQVDKTSSVNWFLSLFLY